jgi:hypothetical protein
VKASSVAQVPDLRFGLELQVRKLAPPFWECELQNFPAYRNAHDKKYQAHHEEEKEQELRYSGSSRGNAKEPQPPGNECD